VDNRVFQTVLWLEGSWLQPHHSLWLDSATTCVFEPQAEILPTP